MRRLWALCGIVVVLGGCAHPHPTQLVSVSRPDRADPKRVAILGDSITVLSTSQINHALEGVYTTDVRAQSGQRIDQMLVELDDALAERPNEVVVNLGTNDVLQANMHWRTSFDRMIAALAEQPCVEITTISTRVNGWGAVPAIAGQINDAIAQAVASHADFHVVDWNAAVHMGGSQLLVSDQVHPSAIGEATLASLVRSALDRDCVRNTPAR